MVATGEFGDRERPLARSLDHRSFTVGIGGPVGSGKTALVRQLCIRFRDEYNIACVTNDIFTREDAEFLVREGALEAGRIAAVETGGCPHAVLESITGLGRLGYLQTPLPRSNRTRFP